MFHVAVRHATDRRLYRPPASEEVQRRPPREEGRLTVRRAWMPKPDTQTVARLLREMPQRTALRGCNPYRAKAYSRAADSLTALAVPPCRRFRPPFCGPRHRAPVQAQVSDAPPHCLLPARRLRSAQAVRSSPVIDTAAPIDAAPLKSQHRVTGFDYLGIPK